jgi:hypothetical protein
MLAPPAGYVVSFTPFHERGFGVPASRFMRALSHYYGGGVAQLQPKLHRLGAHLHCRQRGVPWDRAPLGPVASSFLDGGVLPP